MGAGDVAASASADENVTPDDRPLRILAAEDNPVNQLVLKTLLGQIGLEPVVVANGEEAVAAWAQGDWDLILMDAQMPVMDGVSAAREIRRQEAETGRPATPIVAITANAMAHQVEGLPRRRHERLAVSKPIQIAQLFEAIASATQGGEDRGLLTTAGRG